MKLNNKIIIPKEIIDRLDASKKFGAWSKWEDWQDEVIRKYYGVKTITAIAQVLKKSRSSITARAESLGVKKLDTVH